MKKQAHLVSFLLAIQKLEWSHEGPEFNITVKYCDDPHEYWGWAPPRGDYIIDTGIRDPGLGSGPVKFEDIEWITVHSEYRRGSSPKYHEKYVRLHELVQNIPCVQLTNETIVFNNINA
jgi:hypothetical protein